MMTLQHDTQRRLVAYVHYVMHKCIMVKLGGNEKYIKYVKKIKIHVNFTKSGRKFEKVWEMIMFLK